MHASSVVEDLSRLIVKFRKLLILAFEIRNRRLEPILRRHIKILKCCCRIFGCSCCNLQIGYAQPASLMSAYLLPLYENTCLPIMHVSLPGSSMHCLEVGELDLLHL